MNTASEEAKMTETEFLDAQAADAQAACQETWNDLKSTLKDAASLDVWVRRHPWAATGAAVAGGFLLATILFSPAEAHEAEASHEAEENGRPRASAPRSRRLAWLMGPLLGLLKPMLGQMISSFLGAAMGSAAAQPSGDDAPDDGGAAEGPVPA